MPGGRCGQCRPDSQCRMRPPGTTSGGEPIALTTHRLDQVEAELGAQPPHADVDYVRARVEVVSPYRGEQLALADRLPGVLHQLPEQQELKPGQGHWAVAYVRLQPAHVQHEVAGLEYLVGRVR